MQFVFDDLSISDLVHLLLSHDPVKVGKKRVVLDPTTEATVEVGDAVGHAKGFERVGVDGGHQAAKTSRFGLYPIFLNFEQSLRHPRYFIIFHFLQLYFQI
jgi:hypothetical protein